MVCLGVCVSFMLCQFLFFVTFLVSVLHNFLLSSSYLSLLQPCPQSPVPDVSFPGVSCFCLLVQPFTQTQFLLCCSVHQEVRHLHWYQYLATISASLGLISRALRSSWKVQRHFIQGHPCFSPSPSWYLLDGNFWQACCFLSFFFFFIKQACCFLTEDMSIESYLVRCHNVIQCTGGCSAMDLLVGDAVLVRDSQDSL